ncbi:MAG: 2-amino-4-hydroxy-6-hydroxymethyldihydropteridine diphosphokinase [Chloroflexota bacterium]|nr:2-amino-4-hydroxy-6-hydroxymethyldihydropteridine diphosphokinase [Chloroflexota bacterium]
MTAYLGLGANLGDREANLRRAISLLRRRMSVTRVSSFYETEPWGYADQPRFLNTACAVETSLPPTELLAAVKGVELEIGRVPTFHLGPRLIDIDILFYGDQVVKLPELEVPHHAIAQRAFVLAPLAEIAPELVHPMLGKTMRELLAKVEGKEGVRLWEKAGD